MPCALYPVQGCLDTKISRCRCHGGDQSCSKGHTWLNCRNCDQLTIGHGHGHGHITCRNCVLPHVVSDHRTITFAGNAVYDKLLTELTDHTLRQIIIYLKTTLASFTLGHCRDGNSKYFKRLNEC
jgi:hypothetical protein